jgi:hypothetical protein
MRPSKKDCGPESCQKADETGGDNEKQAGGLCGEVG